MPQPPHDNGPTQGGNGWDHLKALLLYMAVLAAVYGPVVFSGKTLHPALIQPHGLVDGRPYGYDGRTAVNIFNADLPTPAYYEWPINKTVGEIYKKGEIPLWNPHQAGGTPLLADYSTRAFFPYQILEDISPPLTWDIFLLGRALIAGFFTRLFLSIAGLSFRAALIGGLFYMLSGVFGWFISLEELSNVAMTLPALMCLAELFIRKRGLRETAYMGLAIALTIAAGQPEAALYALLLWALYTGFRSINLYRSDLSVVPSLYLKSAIALGIGLLLSAPLTIPFLQNVRQSFDLHPGGSEIGLEYVGNWRKSFGIFTPTATEVPADPSILPGAIVPFKENGGVVSYYRAFATKGAWDYLGGYTGAIAAFLALSGALNIFTTRGVRFKGIIFFFLAFGISVVLKNFGLKPFVWLGSLPLFDRSWSPRWSSPSWIFAVSAAGAAGFQTILEGVWGKDGTGRRLLAPSLAFLSIAVFFVAEPLPSAVTLAIGRDGLFSPAAAPYVVPSVVLGSAVPFISLIASFAIVYYSLKKNDGAALFALVPLAALELWWDIPRGYGATWLYLKAIPFALGIAAVFLFSRKRYYASVGLGLSFLASFLAIDAMSPRGLPARFDPFSEPPYAAFLKEKKERFRVVGGYGVLMPNYAGAAGLYDLRYINALVDPGYLEFRRANLEVQLPQEERTGSSLWFTGLPQRITVNYDPATGVYYRFMERGFEKDLAEKLPHYSFMGVRYILTPSWLDLAGEAGLKGLKLVYDREIRIYENPGALPRAFVTEGEKGKMSGLNINPALIHKGIRIKEVHMSGYRTNGATIEVELERPGLLVLTDVLSPGWKAYVNGQREDIYPVNGVVRGVFLREGRSTVVFDYSPDGFWLGVLLFAGGVAMLFLFILRKRRP